MLLLELNKLEFIHEKFSFKKLVKITGDGKNSQCLDIDLKIASFSLVIGDRFIAHKKGYVNIKLLNKSLLSLKFNTNTEDFKLIRHVFVFGKEVPYDCSL